MLRLSCLLFLLVAACQLLRPSQALYITGSNEGASSIIGSSPFIFGLGWPTSGNFSFSLSPLSLPGLDLGPLLADVNLTSTGGWANFSLPQPLLLTYVSSLRISDTGGVTTECMCSSTYEATAVSVALQLGQSKKPELEGCLVVVDAVVDVGSAVRSVQCDNTCPVNSTVGSITNSAAVAASAAQALKSSLEVLQAINNGDCLVPAVLLAAPEPGLLEEEGIPPEDNSILAIAVTILVALVLIALASVMCCGCCMGCCCWRNAEETEEEKEFLDDCHSLVTTPTLPIWAKVAFFLVVLGNIAFFVSANASVGAEINVDYTYQGDFVDLPPVYDFSMLNSTIELIKAEIYLLGFFFLGFSVIWPYVKLVILATVFSLPTAWVRPIGRASVMEWVDVLGKWSMFDVFALCGAMVIFLVNIQSPETQLHPLGYFGLNLSVIPVWGMFANLIAQILSQLLSVFALWAHHRAYKADWHAAHDGHSPGSLTEDADGKAALAGSQGTKAAKSLTHTDADDKHSVPQMPAAAVMSQDIQGSTMRTKITLFGKLLVGTMLLGVIVLVAMGNFTTCFTVRVVGVLGLVQELAVPGSSTRYFTPLFVAQQMVAAIPSGQTGLAVGTFAIAIIMVASVLVVPIAQAAVLFAVWAVPVRLPTLKTLLKANELLNSWQYIEVLLIALIIGCLQIPMVCALLIGDSCDPIQGALDLLVELGLMSHATCFSMASQAYPGIWCLLAASILLYIASVVVRETGYAVVNTYDQFRAMNSKEPTTEQTLYFRRRASALKTLRLVNVSAVSTPKASGDPPIASPAI